MVIGNTSCERECPVTPVTQLPTCSGRWLRRIARQGIPLEIFRNVGYIAIGRASREGRPEPGCDSAGNEHWWLLDLFSGLFKAKTAETVYFVG